MDAIVEKLIDVDYMVEVQVFRLHKREVVAAACREAMEAKWGVGKVGGWERRRGLRRTTTRLASSTISKRIGASPTAPSAEAPLRVATVALLLARAACAIGATRGLRDIDAGCVVRRVRRLSASKEKKVGFLDLPTAGFLRF